MNVWVVLPSKRPFEQADPVLKLWRERGYKTAIQRDDSEPHSWGTRGEWKETELVIWGPYGGYATAVNTLTREVLSMDKTAQWIVATGDDTEPDASHSAEEIAKQCSIWFAGINAANAVAAGHATTFPLTDGQERKTFGVMQPTGDRWGEDPTATNPAWRTAYIDRVAGSPWLGREFCLRVNQGRGPLWPDYYHMGCDEELQAVTTRLGVFWQRPDLIHLHRHWGRPREGEKLAPSEKMPDFLKRANSAKEWQAYKKLFAEREAAGFPGSEPL